MHLSENTRKICQAQQTLDLALAYWHVMVLATSDSLVCVLQTASDIKADTDRSPAAACPGINTSRRGQGDNRSPRQSGCRGPVPLLWC